MWNHKRPSIATAIPRKKYKAGGITPPNIKLSYKAIEIQPPGTCVKTDTQISEWDRIESPKINPHLHSQLIFNRGNKHTQWAKESLFNKCCLKNRTDTCRNIKLYHLLTPHTRINSKWTKDINVNRESIEYHRKH